MRKLFSFILAFFAVFALAYSAPSMKILNLDKELNFSWGKVFPSQKILTATFPITNVGTDTLIIKDIKPACGCTTAPLDKNVIPPGDTAMMTINFKTHGYKGYITKAISVLSNDPTQEDIYMFIHADIVYPIAMSPNEYIVYLETKVNEPQTQKIILTNTTNKDITIQDISITSGELKINLNPGNVIKANDKLELSVTFSASDTKAFHGAINFKTDCIEDSVFRVFVQGMPKK